MCTAAAMSNQRTAELADRAVARRGLLYDANQGT
jgi:hypothetical protein